MNHSFYVPVFLIKRDVIPGRENFIDFTIDPQYAGQTLNLRQRLHQMFDPARADAWRAFAPWSSLQVQTFAVSAKTPELLAFQSQLITRHRPKLNFAELGEPKETTPAAGKSDAKGGAKSKKKNAAKSATAPPSGS